jgi:hypothetical protein
LVKDGGMKTRAAILLLAGLLPASAAAQTAPIATAPVDPAIVTMVAAVDAGRLRKDDETLVGFRTRNDFSELTSTSTQGVFAARDWLVAQFTSIVSTSGGRMSVRLDTYLQAKTERTPRAVTESSVIATLRGDQPGPLYVMSGHYDDCNGDCTDGTRVAPGADDNGSASSAVLEAARILAPHHFRGTIVFAIFDGEELGLWGSQHYANELKAAGTSVAADLNNDIIGNSTGGNGAHEPGVVRLFSDAADSPSRELARFIGGVVPQYVPDLSVRQIWRDDRFLRGGDQESFKADGYPAVRFVEANENFTHQHQDVRVENGVQFGDLLPYIDFDYVAQVTRANIASLAALASAPPAPPDAQIVVRHLGYDSTLRWSAAPGAVSYEIVWRATDAADWQFSKDVGNVTTATVPVSKDDYILGVRAVDAQGHRSVASALKPVRE